MELTTARVVVDNSKDIVSSVQLRKSNILGDTTKSGRKRINTARATNIENVRVKEELKAARVILTKATNDYEKVLEVKED